MTVGAETSREQGGSSTALAGAHITVADAIDDYLFDRRIRDLSDTTLAMYSQQLRHLLQFAQNRDLDHVAAINADHLRELSARRLEEVKPISVHALQRVLSAFFGYLVRAGKLAADPSAGVAKVRKPSSSPRCLRDDEILALFGAPDRTTFVGIRDFALMLVLHDEMMRIQEALDLRDDDVDLATGDVAVRCGKGGRPRRVRLGRRALSAVLELMARRGPRNGPFVFRNRFGERMCPTSASRRIRTHAAQVGLKDPRCSAHTLRHTGATAFIRAGGNPFALQQLLGHATLDMTRRYVHLASEDVAQEHEKASPADRLGREGRRAIS